MTAKISKLKMTVQFDLSDNAKTFGRFCKALIDGGFEDVVRGIAKELLAEAKRRNLPIAKELEAATK